MPTKIKPIHGSWFEFQHYATVEGVDWNADCARFTTEQWAIKIREMSEAGLKYLVLMDTASFYRSFYDTKIYPKWHLGCLDPLGTVLTAADQCGIKFFIGAGFYGNWSDERMITDPTQSKKRLQSLGELSEIYGSHPSFYGWYWPDEACINPYYTPAFIRYVNLLSQEARKLMPKAPIMIAPYGTRLVKPDDKYIHQLDAMTWISLLTRMRSACANLK